MNNSQKRFFDFKNFSQELKNFESSREQVFHSKSDLSLIIKSLILQKGRQFNIQKNIIKSLIKIKLNESILSVEKVKVKSTFHVLYKIQTENKKYILKISTLNDFYRDFTFVYEQVVQSKLREMGLPYVYIYDIDISRKIFPFDFMIMAYLEGENLESYKGDQSKVYSQLGNIFSEIRKITVSKFGTLNLLLLLKQKKFQGTYKSWEDFIYKNLEKHIYNVFTLGIYNKNEKQLIEKFFDNNRDLLNNINISLLHNDPSARNIITNGRQIIGIIDWEDAIVGDYLWDLAFLDTFLYRKEDNIKFASFCKGYNVDIAQLHSSNKYWLYYLRILLLKIVSRSTSGNYNKQGFEIDKQRMNNVLHILK